MQALDVAMKPQSALQWPELKLHTNWTIPLTVLFAHILALCFITFAHKNANQKKPINKLIVHTVTLQSTPKTFNKTSQITSQVKKEIKAPAQQAFVEAPQQKEAIKEESKISTQKDIVEEETIPVTTAKPKPEPQSLAKASPKPVAKPKESKPKEKQIAKPIAKPLPKPTSKPQIQKKEPAKPKTNDNSKEKIVQGKAAKQKTQAERAKEKTNQDQINKEQRAKQAEAKQQAILNKALSSLDSAGSLESKKSSLAASSRKNAASGPSAIASLSAESLVAFDASETANCTPAERTYYDELVSRLKLSLKLPEYGEVKLQLTINRSGSVVTVQSVKSKSKKNSDYVQKALPKLHLPAFGQNFSGEKEHTFRLTLSNELNY